MPNSVLLRFDGSDSSTVFTDVRGNAFTPANGAALTTSVYRFGGSSGNFNGGGKTISSDSPAGDLSASSDWTIEISVNGAVGDISGDWICGHYKRNPQNTSELQWLLFVSSSYLALNLYSGGAPTTFNLKLKSAIFNGLFHDIALSKVGGSLYFLLDEVLQDTYSYSSSLQSVTDGKMIIGGVSGSFESPSHMYVDDFRLSSDIGLYQSSVPVRTEPFPDDTSANLSASVAGFSTTAFANQKASYRQVFSLGGWNSTYFGSFESSQFFTPRDQSFGFVGWKSSVFSTPMKSGQKSISLRGFKAKTRFNKLKSRRVYSAIFSGFKQTAFPVLHG